MIDRDELRDRYMNRLTAEQAGEGAAMVEGSLAHELAKLLSDSVSFYFRAHGAHWNVIGPYFTPLHDLFGAIADDVHDSLDPLAENIRKLGHFPPSRLSTFLAMSELDEGAEDMDGMALVRDLHGANEVVIGCIKEAAVAADAARDYAVMDFLAKREDAHKTWAWQLRSHLGIA